MSMSKSKTVTRGVPIVREKPVAPASRTVVAPPGPAANHHTSSKSRTVGTPVTGSVRVINQGRKD